MTNRYFLIGAALLSVIVLYTLFYQSEFDENNSLIAPEGQPGGKKMSSSEHVTNEKKQYSTIKNNLDHDALAAILDPNPSINTIADRLEKIKRWKEMEGYSAAEIADAVQNPTVWDFEGTPNTETLPLDDDEKKDGRRFFEANALRVSVSLPGDVIHVSAPGVDTPYELAVEQIKTPRKGVMTMKGQLKNGSGTFTLSQGHGITAGHINASDNTYSFEIFNNTGWVHESGALFTGELPPVPVDNAHHHGDSIGNQGEHIVVKNGVQPPSSHTSEKNIALENSQE